VNNQKYSRPLVVGTLSARQSIESQVKQAVKARLDWLEIRLDTFIPRYAPDAVVHAVRRQWKGPLLLTLRSWHEQGPGSHKTVKLTNEQRKKILTPLLPFVDVIDVELSHKNYAAYMTRLAHQHRVQVIHSTHNFASSGHKPTLNRMAGLSRKLKGDIFKVAVSVSTPAELEAFFIWGLSLKNPRVVLIAMGDVGQISRVLGFCFGSVLTYGHLGAETAPGQMSAPKLRKVIDELYQR
jgi:3-dehydroquinate dehydratase I